MQASNLAVLCDFDDTIAQENVAHLILERFGDGSWKETRRRYLEGLVPPEDYFEKPFAEIRATRSELQAYVREASHLREGFMDMARYCRQQGIELAVISTGLDFYIETLLEKHGLDWVRTYAVGTRFTAKGMEFAPLYMRDDCERWGICKCSIVDRYKEQAKRVIYVGDGLNDLCPARKADLVFARTKLLEMCQEEGLPHRELRDFRDVIDVIKELERH